VAYPGKWEDMQSLTFTYQWYNCRAPGGGEGQCQLVPGATQRVQPIGAPAVCGFTQVWVTARNGTGLYSIWPSAVDAGNLMCG
jgi:hypothetical protein